MIQKFVDRFMAAKDSIRAGFASNRPGDYEEIVKAVVKAITSDEYEDIDPERIHKIDDGHYQGTLLFVIASKNYQPSIYWYVFIGYGSCSGCDTLESINIGSEIPTSDELDQYMTLALHIVQKLKEMKDLEPFL